MTNKFVRFDFLWFQFHFSKGNQEVERVFFFIPERELPDSFFTTLEKFTSFEEYPALERYRIKMDVEGS